MPLPRDSTTPIDCPCGGGAYLRCCGFLHAGEPALTAERLMRSRYSAYVLGLEAYLLATWHSSTRPRALDLAGDGARTKWLGLKVLRHELQDADHAIVEFIARYRVGGDSAMRLHEISRFVREDGRWYTSTASFRNRAEAWSNCVIAAVAGSKLRKSCP